MLSTMFTYLLDRDIKREKQRVRDREREGERCRERCTDRDTESDILRQAEWKESTRETEDGNREKW